MTMTLLFGLVVLAATQELGALNGLVVNATTRQPVAGATVLLIRPEAVANAVAVTTDDRGRFTFSKIVPGTYRLLAEHDDYVRELSPEMRVEVGQPAAAVTLALTPTAVISGRVTDEHGDPLGKIYVRALTPTVVAETRTNDLGEYRLFGLPPDAYVVSAERYQEPTIQNNRLNTPTPPCPDCRGEGTMMQPLPSLLASGGFIDPRALTGKSYPPVFYPGTIDRTAATAVKAGPGARVDGIDLQLITRGSLIPNR